MKNQNKMINYINQEKMPIEYLSLIINVNSINYQYGTLEDFVGHFKLNCVTNGKLLIISEKENQSGKLKFIIDKKLSSFDFNGDNDWIIVFGNQTKGVENRSSSLVNCEIPECSGIDWIGSEITKKGYFVWYKEITTPNVGINWGINGSVDIIMNMYQDYLLKYFKKINSNKLKYHPKIVRVENGRIWYRMDNRDKPMSFTIRHLLENIDL